MEVDDIMDVEEDFEDNAVDLLINAPIKKFNERKTFIEELQHLRTTVACEAW